MILEAIEARMHSPKTEKVFFGERLTIEHLMPEEWQKHWPLGDVDYLDRETVLHTFGNLTLLTKSLNPSISNGPWEKKRESILHNRALNLNRTLPKLWDENQIKERTDTLFEYACRIWPNPEA